MQNNRHVIKTNLIFYANICYLLKSHKISTGLLTKTIEGLHEICPKV